MWYQAKSYLNYLLKSTNRHGVHSPFVFDLVTHCLNDRTAYEDYETINSYRDSLLSDQSVIETREFGAGSRVFKGNERRVSLLAKHVGSGMRENKLLYRLCRYFKPGQMLELGTSLGLGCLSMALGSKEGALTSVEGCSATSETAGNYLQRFGIENATLVVEDFRDFLERNTKSFDFVFIDGDHSREATLEYYFKLKDLAHNDSVLVIDDIYWSAGMTSAWKEIVKDGDATVTIDLFHLGLVFFRKEQKKQHFRIRL